VPRLRGHGQAAPGHRGQILSHRLRLKASRPAERLFRQTLATAESPAADRRREPNMNEVLAGVTAFVILMTILVWLGLTV
jgi:hypothetical protein